MIAVGYPAADFCITLRPPPRFRRCRAALAQSYPVACVASCASTPAGGTTDIAAFIAQWLTDRLGQPFVVENRPGAAPTSRLSWSSLAAGRLHALCGDLDQRGECDIFDRLNFNFVRDLAMVGGVVRSPLVLEVNPAVPVNTVPALVAYAKANPGKISLASFGVGSTSHVAGELFKMMAGVNMTHVPYRGSTPLVTDLLGGQVQAAFDNLPASIEHIRAGRLRALAVSTAARGTAAERASAGRVPARLRSERLGRRRGAEEHARRGDRRLDREINAGLADPKIKARLTDLGGAVFAVPPAEFTRHVTDETEKWGKVIRAANIKAE